MGSWKNVYVIAEFYDDRKWYKYRERGKSEYRKIMAFYNKLTEKQKLVFLKSDFVTNGGHCMIMHPDNSKRGWGTSEYYVNIRKKFVSLLEEAGIRYYKIVDDDYYDEPRMSFSREQDASEREEDK